MHVRRCVGLSICIGEKRGGEGLWISLRQKRLFLHRYTQHGSDEQSSNGRGDACDGGVGEGGFVSF